MSKRAMIIIAGVAALVLAVGSFLGGVAYENNRIQNEMREAFSSFGEDLESAEPTDMDVDTSDAPLPDDEETEAPAVESTLGKSFTYDDGLEVRVSEPREFTPSEYAGDDGFPLHLKFKVTVINGSDQPYEPIDFQSSMSSDGAEGSAVYDEGMMPPQTTVLPGKRVSFWIAYGVTTKDALTVQVQPSWDHERAVFVS